MCVFADEIIALNVLTLIMECLVLIICHCPWLYAV